MKTRFHPYVVFCAALCLFAACDRDAPIGPVNQQPVITSPDTSFAAGGVHYLYRPQVSDPDNSNLTLSFLHTPEWITTDADSAFGTPPNRFGIDSICVVASDGFLSDTAVVHLRLMPPLVVYGDTRTGHDAHRRVVSRIMDVQPAVVLHVGDLVNDGNLQSDWDIFNDITVDMQSGSEFFPALGNHEHQSPLYFDNFDLPGNEQWYSVVRNRTHFIILNSCVDIGPGSAQYEWLVSDLASVGDSVWFTVAVFHHPPYSTGAHAEDEMGLRDILVPLFEEYGVDIVFNGHDHHYERSFCGDIYYIVTGGGGAPLRDQIREHPCSQLFLKEYEFCKLSVLPNKMFIEVINDSGLLIDSFEIQTSPPSQTSNQHRIRNRRSL